MSLTVATGFMSTTRRDDRELTRYIERVKGRSCGAQGARHIGFTIFAVGIAAAESDPALFIGRRGPAPFRNSL